MKTWYLKCTPTKVDLTSTTNLARQDGFVCRAAYEPLANGKLRRTRLTAKVAFGDTLHVYFVDAGAVTPVGTFSVVQASKHRNGVRCGTRVAGTSALYEVTDRSFASLITGLPGDERYRKDPARGAVTGWLVEQLEVVTPAYTATRFPGRHTLRPGWLDVLHRGLRTQRTRLARGNTRSHTRRTRTSHLR